MNDYKANPLPESELEIKLTNILNEFRRNVKEAKVMGGQAYAHAQIAQLLAQEYARGKQDALNKVREQANGSYEVRTPKEPEYMVWEIAEWQLKDIEKLKEQG